MKKLEINYLSEISGGNTCFWLGFAAVVTVLTGPIGWAAANAGIAVTAHHAGCFD